MPSKYLPNLILISLLIAIITLATSGNITQALALKLLEPTKVISFLMVLLLVSAIIERALEFLVAVWFVSGTDEKRLALSTARHSDNNEAIATALLVLTKRRRHVQSYVLLCSLAISLAISISGFRILAPLLESNVMRLSTFQQEWFFVTDVIVTATVLAGGTEGMHKLVSVVTRYLDNTRNKLMND